RKGALIAENFAGSAGGFAVRANAVSASGFRHAVRKKREIVAPAHKADLIGRAAEYARQETAELATAGCAAAGKIAHVVGFESTGAGPREDLFLIDDRDVEPEPVAKSGNAARGVQPAHGDQRLATRSAVGRGLVLKIGRA